jgi:hypothetical protein
MSLILWVAAMGGQPYHRFLLAKAQELSDDDYHAPAIVMAQMACEIATEQVISAAYKQRGIADLEDPVNELFPAFNLGNERLRRLYLALTGDVIQEQPWWSEYIEHTRRRNRVVHHGERPSKEDAEASISVAKQFADHLDARLSELAADLESSAGEGRDELSV